MYYTLMAIDVNMQVEGPQKDMIQNHWNYLFHQIFCFFFLPSFDSKGFIYVALWCLILDVLVIRWTGNRPAVRSVLLSACESEANETLGLWGGRTLLCTLLHRVAGLKIQCNRVGPVLPVTLWEGTYSGCISQRYLFLWKKFRFLGHFWSEWVQLQMLFCLVPYTRKHVITRLAKHFMNTFPCDVSYVDKSKRPTTLAFWMKHNTSMDSVCMSFLPFWGHVCFRSHV